MSFLVAACDLTAMEATAWLDKPSAATGLVSIAPGGYCRCLLNSAVPLPQCRRAAAATSPGPTKRQRVASPHRIAAILIPRSPAHPATATQSAITSPVQRPCAPIERLSCALLLIAPFLSTPDKLLQLTRLSHSFPALTAACFRVDAFNASRAFIAALFASTARRRLFSQLQSLTSVYQPPQLPSGIEQPDEQVVEGQKVVGDELLMSQSASYLTLLQQLVELLTPSSQPAALPPVFPALSSLTLVLGPQLTQSLCNGLFATLPSLPHLATLHFGMHDKDKGERVTSAAISQLRHCHSLRHLTLDNHAIDHNTFHMLCTLPLAHLDLSGTKLVQSLTADVSPTASSAWLLEGVAEGVGSAWCTVLLPKAKQEADSEVIDAVLSAYFRSVSAQQHMDMDGGEHASSRFQSSPAAGVLKYLNCNSQLSSGVYSCLAGLSSLTTLDLDGVRVNADTLEASPFFTPFLAPRFPHLQHFVSPRNYREVGDDDKEKQLQRVSQFYLSFLASVAGQLRTLRLKVPDTCLSIEVVNAVFKCHQLRRLTLSLYSYAYSEDGTVESPELPDTPAVPLHHLHFLKLHGLPVTDAGLAALLRGCPNVEDLKLAKSDMLTSEGLEAIGLSCPLLRRLTVKSCELVLGSSGRESVGLPCTNNGYVMADNSTVRIFPSLTFLSIVNYTNDDGGVNEYSPLDYSPSALRVLLSLLCCSPITYLRLHIDLTPAQLPIFQPLTHLRYLRASTTLPDHLHRFFTDRADDACQAAPGLGGRLLSEGRVSVEEMRWKWLVKARVADSPSLFVSEAVFDGLTGREAFFEALAQERGEECSDGEEEEGEAGRCGGGGEHCEEESQ